MPLSDRAWAELEMFLDVLTPADLVALHGRIVSRLAVTVPISKEEYPVLELWRDLSV